MSKNDVRTMQRFVDTLVGIPRFSYPAKKNAPRPEGEFAHVQLLEEYQEGIPANFIYSQTDEQTVFRTHSLSRLRFRIGIVETNGIASTKVMHGWTSEVAKALMMETGYGFIRAFPVGLEDAKLEKQWEERQAIAVEMYVTRTLEETVDNITGLSITGEFTEADTVHTMDITINE